jgi:hypothetical protein
MGGHVTESVTPYCSGRKKRREGESVSKQGKVRDACRTLTSTEFHSICVSFEGFDGCAEGRYMVMD